MRSHRAPCHAWCVMYPGEKITKLEVRLWLTGSNWECLLVPVSVSSQDDATAMLLMWLSGKFSSCFVLWTVAVRNAAGFRSPSD